MKFQLNVDDLELDKELIKDLWNGNISIELLFVKDKGHRDEEVVEELELNVLQAGKGDDELVVYAKESDNVYL